MPFQLVDKLLPLMNNLNKKNLRGDLVRSVIVMLIGLPVATGLLYLVMTMFHQAPTSSMKGLFVKSYADHIKKNL
jgi:hypothetical protein